MIINEAQSWSNSIVWARACHSTHSIATSKNFPSNTKAIQVSIRLSEFQFINVIYCLERLAEEFIWPQAFTHLSHNSITHRKKTQHENWKRERNRLLGANYIVYTNSIYAVNWLATFVISGHYSKSSVQMYMMHSYLL